MLKIFIGIDPGLSGSVVALMGTKLRCWDIPILSIQSGKTTKKQYDLAKLNVIFSKIAGVPDCHILIEKVGPMPKQGITSTFNFGVGYGMLQAFIVMTKHPYTFVTPVRWKKVMMDGMGKEKDASRLRAKQLFPDYADMFSRVKDDGRAEAALLAEYGKRLLTGAIKSE